MRRRRRSFAAGRGRQLLRRGRARAGALWRGSVAATWSRSSSRVGGSAAVVRDDPRDDPLTPLAVGPRRRRRPRRPSGAIGGRARRRAGQTFSPPRVDQVVEAPDHAQRGRRRRAPRVARPEPPVVRERATACPRGRTGSRASTSGLAARCRRLVDPDSMPGSGGRRRRRRRSSPSDRRSRSRRAGALGPLADLGARCAPPTRIARIRRQVDVGIQQPDEHRRDERRHRRVRARRRTAPTSNGRMDGDRGAEQDASQQDEQARRRARAADSTAIDRSAVASERERGGGDGGVDRVAARTRRASARRRSPRWGRRARRPRPRWPPSTRRTPSASRTAVGLARSSRASASPAAGARWSIGSTAAPASHTSGRPRATARSAGAPRRRRSPRSSTAGSRPRTSGRLAGDRSSARSRSAPS